MRNFVLILTILLAACDGQFLAHKMHQNDGNQRFVYIAPTPIYPAMILDTVTGCLQAITAMQAIAPENADLNYLTDIQKVQIGFGAGKPDRACFQAASEENQEAAVK